MTIRHCLTITSNHRPSGRGVRPADAAWELRPRRLMKPR